LRTAIRSTIPWNALVRLEAEGASKEPLWKRYPIGFRG
jgi:hypothetical protein